MGDEMDRAVEDNGLLLRFGAFLLPWNGVSALNGALHRMRAAVLGQYSDPYRHQPFHGDPLPDDIRHGARRARSEMLQARRPRDDHGDSRRSGDNALDGGRDQREGERLFRARPDARLHLGREPAHFIGGASLVFLHSRDLFRGYVCLRRRIPQFKNVG